MAKIKMPNGYEVFLDNSFSNYEDRLRAVKDQILEYDKIDWESYFNDTWLNEKGVTSDILDRAGTFLLTGNFLSGNMITRRKQESISQKEIPVSSTNTGVENLIYGVPSNTDVEGITVADPVLRADEEIDKDVYDMSVDDMNRQKRRARKSKKKWKQTRTAKLNRLYSTREIRTYRVKPVKDENGKVKKMFSGRPVLDAIYVTIGGNKGIAEYQSNENHVPYTSEWCLVDINNVFTFDGIEFKIDESVTGYAVSNKFVSHSSDFENSTDMDKILCFKIPGVGYKWYDQSITEIPATQIKQLTGDTINAR